MDYKEAQLAVYGYLQGRHQQDSDFRFSLRNNFATDGSSGLFIGTDTPPGYFGFTLWYIPLFYRGASGDLIDYAVEWNRKQQSVRLVLKYFISKAAVGPQNEGNLALKQAIVECLPTVAWEVENPKNKQARLLYIAKNNILTPAQLVTELDSLISSTATAIDAAIAKVKQQYPQWKADRYDATHFDQMLKRIQMKKADWLDTITVTPPNKPAKPPVETNMQFPLNQILYGPPGTGKTYRTIELAAEIATGGPLPETKGKHAAAKQLFDKLRGDQIEFVTFHQNYAYEDFMLGIRPNLNAGDLGFQQQEGVFFKICQRATENYLARSSNSQSVVVKRPFREVFSEFIKPLVEAEEADKKASIAVKMAKGDSFKITALNENNLSFIKPSGGTGHTLSLQTLETAYNTGKHDHYVGLPSYYVPLTNELLKLGQQQRATEPLKNYVLVIDEINRANISRVFGELITLLEDDKRLGGDNALTVRLPSGEEFAVPPNLHLLGTMNTADKSIALVDVALRRRFEFVGIYPNPELLDPTVKPVFVKLNQQIYEAKKSADFLIGHAYFLGKTATDMPDVLNKKVVPLLLEYFSGRTDLVEDQLKKALANTGLKITRNAAYQLEVSV